MAPTNTSFLSARQISSLPFDVTQTDINDGGVNFTVYYKFTAPENARVIGAWGFSGNVGSGYRARLEPYNGPAGSPTQILSISELNKPIQFPVVPGQEYFLEFEKNSDTAGPEDLRVQVYVAPLEDIVDGNILVNDDSNGFPLAVLSESVDHEVINFVKDIAAGEGGDIFRGIIVLEKFSDNTIRVYNNEFTEISNLSMAAGTPRIRTCRGLKKFFMANSRNPSTIQDILLTGAYGAVNLTTTYTSVLGFAVSNDGLIAYNSSNTSGSAIRRWDMSLNVAMADLVAGVVGEFIVDILVLSDNTIVALSEVFGGSGAVTIRRYNAAGVLLNTYSGGVNTEPAGTFSRLAYALDDPVSFWQWLHPSGTTGISHFKNIKVVDGTVLTTRVHTEYEVGGYEGDETSDPTARFGNSFSCPFMIMSSGNLYPGIYIFTKNKPNDSVNNSGTLVDLAIPDPTFKTGLLG